MDDSEKLNEASFSVKKEFCNNLNMESITNADYMHPKRICKDFEIKKLGENYDSYLKNGTLLLAHIFENFKQMWLKIYHLDPTNFFPASGLPWQAGLKRTK